MTDRNVTKVELCQNGDLGCIVKEWAAGWQFGSPATAERYVQQGDVERILRELEKEGFCCYMPDPENGIALRGEITRIDFIVNLDGVRVKKWPFGWTFKTPPISDEQKPPAFNLDEALDWCQRNGWTVRRYPGGARAWKGEPQPVRDRATIQFMRKGIQRDFVNGRMDPRSNFDLAFDC